MLMKKLILSILGIASSLGTATSQERIVNGIQAEFDTFPYYTHVKSISKADKSGYLCGGTLIAPDFVLTSAHCEKGSLDDWTVEVYANAMFRGGGYQSRKCKRWINHPGWVQLEDDKGSLVYMDYDFALCELNRPVYIQQSSVVLDLNNVNDTYPLPGVDVTQVGLGTVGDEDGTKPNWLQFAVVPAITNEQCYGKYDDLVTDNVLCVKPDGNGKQGTCKGDSGGPNVVNEKNVSHTLVGVTSFSYCETNKKFPRGLARTSRVMYWVYRTACDVLLSVGDFCKAYRCQTLLPNSYPNPDPYTWNVTDTNYYTSNCNNTYDYTKSEKISTYQQDQTGLLFPYFVKIQIDNGDLFKNEKCGGTLIGPDMVLTAASCGHPDNIKESTVYANNMYVHGGAEERKCKEWVTHDKWIRDYDVEGSSLTMTDSLKEESFKKMDYDFALCKLNEPVYLHQAGLVLELNTDNLYPKFEDLMTEVSLSPPPSGDTSLTTKTHDYFVFKKQDEVSECTELAGSSFNLTTLLCGTEGTQPDDGTPATCLRDVGGPVIRIVEDRHILVGVSGSLSESYDSNCGERSIGRLSSVTDWIVKTACNTLNSVSSICRLDEEDGNPGTLSTYIYDKEKKDLYQNLTKTEESTKKPTKKKKKKNPASEL